MACKTRACMWRMVFWAFVGLAGYCVYYGIFVGTLGSVLFALPPVMVAVVATEELRRAEPDVYTGQHHEIVVRETARP